MIYLSFIIKKINIILIYLILFLVTDLIFSNFIYTKKFKNNCIINKNNFYYLENNCYFKQKYIKNNPAYDVYTNNLGNRYSKKEYDPNLENIFYFGDSFTYGLGLKYEKTYVGIIEKEKNNFNHHNFALQGYSPSVYLYQLNKMINENIFPSKIFLALDFTDIFEEVDRWDYKINYIHPILKNSTQFNNENINKDNDFKYNNFKGSIFIAQTINNFFRSIKLYYKQKTKKNPIIPGQTDLASFLYLGLDELNEAAKKSFKEMSLANRSEKIAETVLKISKLSKEIGSDFYIIIYPWPDTLQYGQKSFNWVNYSNNMCSKVNCKKLINTFNEFDKIKNSNKEWLKKLFILEDLHFNEFGNSVIAKEVLKEF